MNPMSKATKGKPAMPSVKTINTIIDGGDEHLTLPFSFTFVYEWEGLEKEIQDSV